jgi:hypothetical protein
MSDYQSKIDARIMVLERQMPEVRKLASDASKEVGDVRAQYRGHNRLLEALRKTQLDHYAEMRAGFTEMRVTFAKVNVGMTLIAARLGIEEWDSDDS